VERTSAGWPARKRGEDAGPFGGGVGVVCVSEAGAEGGQTPLTHLCAVRCNAMQLERSRGKNDTSVHVFAFRYIYYRYGCTYLVPGVLDVRQHLLAPPPHVTSVVTAVAALATAALVFGCALLGNASGLLRPRA
jgi:hypothetical protein